MKGKQQDTCRGSSSTAAYLLYKYMSVYILLNKYLYETLAISCKNIEYIYTLYMYVYVSFCLQRGQRSLCLRPLWGFVCVALVAPTPFLSPPSLIISVRFCCRLFATVVFPFWQLARFVYLCLFKSNAEPAWLALPCLGLAWLCWPF